MITKTSTFAGFLCPVCGEIQIQKLSAFAFSGPQDHALLCKACKQPAVALLHTGKKEYQVGIGCADCARAHAFPVKRGFFWQCEEHTFLCPHTEELLLAIGEKERVATLLEESFFLQENPLL